MCFYRYLIAVKFGFMTDATASACFKKGQWFDHLVFNAYELEDFNLINDQNEIDQVLAEARAALGKPLSLDGETI